MAKKPVSKTVEALKHSEATRLNIPTAELQSVVSESDHTLLQIAYERRNRDLDPQLMWRGKDEQDWSDLVVASAPLYIQEKVHPKVLIDDLMRTSKASQPQPEQEQLDLFADFNGIPEGADKTEFYQHEQNWSNRMILGDSLQVMASLAEREGLRGQVQCIYLDPPYGIKFNSNFQWSTTSRNVTDGKVDHITREPEQVQAFRDTWRDGIHSYLTYLRDRLTVARDLLAESGSIFVQISDENVHRVRALLDEVFGEDNFCSLIFFSKTTGTSSGILPTVGDLIIWYAKSRSHVKFRQILRQLPIEEQLDQEFKDLLLPDLRRRKTTDEERNNASLIPPGARLYRTNTAVSPEASATLTKEVTFLCGVKKHCGEERHWKTGDPGLWRLEKADRLDFSQGPTRIYRRFFSDSEYASITNVWTDTRSEQKQVYVVQTKDEVIKRCILMATDPGDLVLDPTCGSGTTSTVSEQWGRRWITIDTSRVALALARARVMGARYPFYLLADSREGQLKEAEVTRAAPSTQPSHGNLRLGFVYERVPHIMLSSISSNTEIDVIWDEWQEKLEPLRESLNEELQTSWQEWDIPRETAVGWPESAKRAHADWWQARIARQSEIDASIAAKAEFEYLYDKPYQDNKIVRVAGPFTVESLSPHRVLGVDENDELIDAAREGDAEYGAKQTFPQMILENLRIAGVQQAHREDRISFTELVPWPGDLICADGHYLEGQTEKRAAIFIGPEFGTVQRADLVDAAREAGDAAFDVLIACAFNYEAHATEFSKLGRIPVLKARMNADLHMAEDLKNTGKGNLFVIFGEPDITLLTEPDGRLRVKVNGVDVFKPQTGEVVSSGADGIACWFIDTDYNGESFFVRHAYFLGANDPYSALKTTLKTEINAEAWETLHSDTSRPFERPATGRIAVKVINHLGDEVMKVFRV
jgi:adenine-specific DNA-methyltransferase